MGEHVEGISCKHEWHTYTKASKGKPEVKVCGVDFDRDDHNIGCGASAVFDERNKIVEYDRTFNWGKKPVIVLNNRDFE